MCMCIGSNGSIVNHCWGGSWDLLLHSYVSWCHIDRIYLRLPMCISIALCFVLIFHLSSFLIRCLDSPHITGLLNSYWSQVDPGEFWFLFRHFKAHWFVLILYNISFGLGLKRYAMCRTLLYPVFLLCPAKENNVFDLSPKMGEIWWCHLYISTFLFLIGL